jgi:DNA primase
VKQGVDIVDVVAQVVPLRRSGNRHVGVCPFHKEKTPSFHVDSENQFFHCFGCGSGGDVLTFVMKYQNISFGDAVRYLADRYHIPLPQEDFGKGFSPAQAEASRKERDELYGVLKEAADFFYRQLHHSQAGGIARDYLQRRSLPPHVVETEKLGYAPSQWDGLSGHLTRLGVSAEVGIKAGLLARSSKDENRVYDRFRNRLIFPITNDRGQVVGFGGRSLAAELKDEPKYLNSPETAVYQKGRMLYQLARAREACREVRQVVLVEGYMDLLAFHAQGFYRVVATLGTALTVQQVRLVSRMADEVVLAYDGDTAGERAMLRALPLILQEEVPTTCVVFPNGMDPDDFLKAEGLEGFDRLLKDRRDLGAFAIGKTLDGWDGSTAGKTNVLRELQPLLDGVRQPVLMSEYSRLIADKLSLSEEVIRSQIQHDKGRTARKAAPADVRVLGKPSRILPLSGDPGVEECIVRVMIKYPELIEEVRRSEALCHFRESGLKSLGEVLVKACDAGGGSFEASAVYDLLDDAELRQLYTRFTLECGDLSEARLHLRDWLDALCGQKDKWDRLDLRKALRQAEHERNEPRVRDLLAQIQSLCSGKKKG